MDSGTLTPLLKRLQVKNLVQRERNQTDERTVMISLTESGKSLEHQASEIPLKIANCLNLNETEIAVLHKIIGQFKDK